MYKVIALFFLIAICSCSNDKIEVEMRGYFGGYEDWSYGNENILVEPSSK